MENRNGFFEWIKSAMPLSLFPLGVLLLATMCIFYINCFCIEYNLNGEMAFEMIIAKNMAIEKSLYPVNIYYGYDLAALRPVVLLAAILSGFIDNMSLCYGLALNITLLLVYAALFFLLYQFEISFFSSSVALAAAVFIPVGDVAYSVYFLCGYLANTLLAACLIFGIYLWLAKSPKLNHRHYLVFAAITAASFMLGTNGIRMFQAFFVPMIASIILFYLIKCYSDGEQYQLAKKDIFLATQLFACCAGFFLFRFWHENRIFFVTNLAERAIRNSVNMVATFPLALSQMLQAFNVLGSKNFFTAQGLSQALTVLVFFLFLMGCSLLVRAKKEAPVFALLFFCIVPFMITVCIDWRPLPRYYFMCIIAIAGVTGLCLDLIPQRQRAVKFALSAFLALFCLSNVWLYAMPKISEIADTTTNEYDKLGKEIIRQLEAKGYTEAYGSGYMHILQIGPLSNFRIQTAYNLYDPNSDAFYINRTMGSRLVFDPARSKEPSFYIFDDAQRQARKATQAQLDANNTLSMAKDTITVNSPLLGNSVIYLFDINPFIDVSMLPYASKKGIYHPSGDQYQIINATKKATAIYADKSSKGTILKSPPIKGDNNDYRLSVFYGMEDFTDESLCGLTVKLDGKTVQNIPLKKGVNSVTSDMFQAKKRGTFSYEISGGFGLRVTEIWLERI